MALAFVVALLALAGAAATWGTWRRQADERRSVAHHQQALETLRHMSDRQLPWRRVVVSHQDRRGPWRHQRRAPQGDRRGTVYRRREPCRRRPRAPRPVDPAVTGHSGRSSPSSTTGSVPIALLRAPSIPQGMRKKSATGPKPPHSNPTGASHRWHGGCLPPSVFDRAVACGIRIASQSARPPSWWSSLSRSESPCRLVLRIRIAPARRGRPR